jgi:hypothetical protein
MAVITMSNYNAMVAITLLKGPISSLAERITEWSNQGNKCSLTVANKTNTAENRSRITISNHRLKETIPHRKENHSAVVVSAVAEAVVVSVEAGAVVVASVVVDTAAEVAAVIAVAAAVVTAAEDTNQNKIHIAYI